jgi:hypothetical protein
LRFLSPIECTTSDRVPRSINAAHKVSVRESALFRDGSSHREHDKRRGEARAERLYDSRAHQLHALE